MPTLSLPLEPEEYTLAVRRKSAMEAEKGIVLSWRDFFMVMVHGSVPA